MVKKRRLLSVTLLLLRVAMLGVFVVSVTVWGRSWVRNDSLWNVEGPAAQYELDILDGVCYLRVDWRHFIFNATREEPPAKENRWQWDTFAGQSDEARVTRVDIHEWTKYEPKTLWVRAGFRFPHLENPWWMASCPLWAIAGLAGTGAATVWYRPMRDRMRKRKAGCCRKCGYDLRASEERCPECGTAIPLNPPM